MQALAAQSWLASHNIPTRLRIGVRPDASKPSGIEPHAWLTCGKVVIVGGNVDSQIELIAATTNSH